MPGFLIELEAAIGRDVLGRVWGGNGPRMHTDGHG